ncbi:ribonuclease III [candidate division WS6 bacterium RIFOXYC1_FULL_33_10]|uniref:Ribonuclease 3 n=2 Tax=Candidatus Dojkabacteria TaxID=74243 RepID=A0A1F4UJJ3_9BACT|nr:MAG: ribonuclease III [candidate division WS6 bacterium RIFOXYB1_FULL_33_14]OGC46357.1 MAG: ribonuclease III [candidate division WS6 bacterium RIFOXYC1_FULL_33_10]
MNSIQDFEKRIGVEFKNKDLLLLALTHRSYVNEHKDVDAHNERLEFLGDAVLELITSDYLFNTYPERTEGDLTSFRAALVRTESLADTAQEIEIGENIRLSKGEEDTGGRAKSYLLANAFEAIIGAIYLDSGYEVARDFVHTHLLKKIEHIVENRLDIDSKTKIQEVTQSKYKVTPVYEVIEEEGPDHDKRFTVVVKINGKEIGKGFGTSKQKAEEDAAKSGIEYIENDNN